MQLEDVCFRDLKLEVRLAIMSLEVYSELDLFFLRAKASLILSNHVMRQHKRLLIQMKVPVIRPIEDLYPGDKALPLPESTSEDLEVLFIRFA